MSKTWKDVQKLRKDGNPQEAIDLATRILSEDERDQKTRQQAEWAFYDLIKKKVFEVRVDENENRSPPREKFFAFQNLLYGYAKLRPERPGMALSNILNQLTKHDAGQRIDKFVHFLMWCGVSGLFREEDFQPNDHEGKSYDSLSHKVAREATAWIMKRRERNYCDELEFVLNLVLQAKSHGKDRDKIWLEWDLVKLLRSVGRNREAAELLGPIVKQKKNDWWVWAEAGRLYSKDNLSLAISCFCRGFSLCSEAKFLGKAHCELALLLVHDEDRAQASQEVLQAVAIYDKESRKYPRELENLLTAEWYDPTASAKPPADYYSEHAEDALLLCFDSVDESAANFIGTMELKGKKRPIPLFAVKQGIQCISILGKRVPKSLAGATLGAPVALLIGSVGENREILEVTARDSGTLWDQLDVKSGIILPSKNAGRIPIYFSKEHTGYWSPGDAHIPGEFLPGSGVIARVAAIPKTGQPVVCSAEKADMHVPDSHRFRGDLRLHEKGFGFIGDVFIPRELLREVQVDGHMYEGIAVFNWDKKKERYGLCAVQLKVLSQQ